MRASERRQTRRRLLQLGAAAAGSMLPAAAPGTERFLSITATPAPAPAPAPAASAAAAEPADTVLINGNVITMDSANRIAQAVAIRDGRIMGTGTTEAARAQAGPNTRVINLGGKTVTPGLIDAHNHLQVWGMMLVSYVPLVPPDVTTLDQLLSRLKSVIAKTPSGQWIQGYFWNISPLPDRTYLDPIAPNHPLWVIQQGGHYGCANSLAMKIAGITAQTPDPEGGIIQRDAKGEPTGVFYNHRAMDMVRQYIPQPTAQQVTDYITYGDRKMIAAGVTTVHDNNARYEAVQGYFAAGRARTMTVRSQIFYTLEWPGDVTRATKEIERYVDEYMRFAGYKFLIDGQLPTWYTHEPHVGISWNMPTWNPEQFKQAIRILHATGLQISVHACGDAAIDLTLDAYEAAMNASPRSDPRHRIEHAILCSQTAVRRAADLGVVISAQPQFVHFATASSLIAQIGEERAARAIVTREWLDAGIRLALGSDTPTSPWYRPQVTLAGAVWREDLAGKPFHPEQQITIQEALRAHTMGSAYAAFEEKVKGSLETGKFADLIVWNDNIYNLAPLELAEAEIAMTMIGGKIVYQIMARPPRLRPAAR